jgi:hypothetical protein
MGGSGVAMGCPASGTIVDTITVTGLSVDRARVGYCHVMLHGAIGHRDVGGDDIVLRLEVRMAHGLQQVRQPRANGAIVRVRLARCQIAEHRRIIGGEHVDAVVAEEIAEILAIEGSHPAGVFVARLLERFRPHGLYAQLAGQRQPMLVDGVLDRVALPLKCSVVGLARADQQ